MHQEKKPWIVLKFGGSSQTREGYGVAMRHIRQLRNTHRIVVVLSAIRGTTCSLLNYCKSFDPNVIDGVLAENCCLANACGVDSPRLLDLASDLRSAAQRAVSQPGKSQQLIDLVAIGESFPRMILSELLNTNGIANVTLDAATFIRSNLENDVNSMHLSGKFRFDAEQFNESTGDSEIVICQGFVGSTPSRQLCLLSRGGGDTSSAIIAAGIDAVKLQIFTDVDGMFTADPNKVPNAQLIRDIRCGHAQELAAMGAKVMHPYSVLPCAEKGIPIEIRNTYRYELGAGTTISDKPERFARLNRVYALTEQSNITLFTVTSVDMWNNYGFVHDIFRIFSQFNVDVNIITTSQFNITTTTDESNPDRLAKVRKALERNYQVEVDGDCSIVSVVADSIKSHPCVDRIMSSVRERNCVKVVHFSANHLSVSLVVKRTDAQRLLGELHYQLIESRNLKHPVEPVDDARDQWWRQSIPTLQRLSEHYGSAYVYCSRQIRETANRLRVQLPVIDRVFYAVKANNHPEILKTLYRSNVGFECVSIWELRLLEHMFGSAYSRHHPEVLFTPNFCQIEEYAEAFKSGLNVNVVLDNPDLAVDNPQIFGLREFGLRLDLNMGDGHHKKVVTEGTNSKFGCGVERAIEFARSAKAMGSRIVGLHSHRGSGIHDYRSWVATARKLLALRSHFPHLKWIDLGGGIGVSEPVDFDSMNRELTELRDRHPGIKFYLEPGRYLVSKAGVLVSQVTQTKQKSGQTFLGLHTGMNSLLRPALYGARHQMHNISNCGNSHGNLEIYQVVGPICESGDILGESVELPVTRAGDTILIEQAGAYGRVMSMSYNMREPAREFVL